MARDALHAAGEGMVAARDLRDPFRSIASDVV